MFKSSENLRLAAAMRALERVAAPWREARRTWFDGTPESIEARLASTDRVLAYARAGYTAAHLNLTTEAAAARRELLAAKHRLLTDFLDDGARAFKGSRRVASGWDDHPDYHLASRRQAGPLGPGYDHFGLDDIDEYDDYLHRHDYHTDPDDLRGLEHKLRPGFDDDDPARYSSRRTAGGETCRHCGEEIELDHHPEGDWVHPDTYERRYDGDYPVETRERDHSADPDDDDPARYSRLAGAHDPDPDEPWRNTIDDDPYRDMLPTPEFGDLPPDGDYQGKHRLPPSHPDNGLSGDPIQRHLDALHDDDPFYDEQVDREVGRYLDEGVERSRDWGHLGSRTAAALPDFDDQLLFDS